MNSTIIRSDEIRSVATRSHPWRFAFGYGSLPEIFSENTADTDWPIKKMTSTALRGDEIRSVAKRSVSETLRTPIATRRYGSDLVASDARAALVSGFLFNDQLDWSHYRFNSGDIDGEITKNGAVALQSPNKQTLVSTLIL